MNFAKTLLVLSEVFFFNTNDSFENEEETELLQIFSLILSQTEDDFAF